MGKKHKCKDCEDCRRSRLGKLLGKTAKVYVAAATVGTSFVAEKAHKALLSETCPDGGHYMMHHTTFKKRIEAEAKKADEEQQEAEKQQQREQEKQDKKQQKALAKRLNGLIKQLQKLKLDKAVQSAEKATDQLADTVELLEKAAFSVQKDALYYSDYFHVTITEYKEDLILQQESILANIEDAQAEIRRNIAEFNAELTRLQSISRASNLRVIDLDEVSYEIPVVETQMADLTNVAKQDVQNYQQRMKASVSNIIEYADNISTWFARFTTDFAHGEILLIDKVQFVRDGTRTLGILILSEDILRFYEGENFSSLMWTMPFDLHPL